MKKEIYLCTTKGCKACDIMTNILKEFCNNNQDFTLIIKDFNELPTFIKINVPINDFPITVFVINDVIKYHFDGTISIKKVNNIVNDLVSSCLKLQ